VTSPAITNPLPPWVRGIADNLAAAKLLLDSVLESRNRLALILLDSALEIGFREYLENVKKITGLDDDAMKHRENLIKVVGRNSKITEDDWTQIDFFYELRCNCYHESASLTLNDTLIAEFYTLVSSIVDLLFDVTISAHLPDQADIIRKSALGPAITLPINKARSEIDEIIMALFDGPLKSTKEIAERLKQKGSRRRLTPSKISGRMSATKHFFYDGPDGWTLSDAGRDRFFEIFDRATRET